MVTRARGGNARKGITRITLAAGFAGTISFPVVHWLAEGLGWRLALISVGLFVTLVVAPLLWVGARALGPQVADPPTPASHGRTRPGVFWALGLGLAALGLVHGALLQHFLPILDERAVSAGVAVLLVSCIGPMQVAGRLLMVATETRVSAHGYLMGVYGALALAVGLLWAAGGAAPALAVFVILFGGSYGMISILRPVVVREVLGGEGFGAKSGKLALMYLSASAFAAYLGAIVWRVGGYGLMLACLLAVLAAGAVLYHIARR